MSEPVLLSSVADRVATLTLNRPEKRNALNGELVEALDEAVAAAGSDERVGVVVLTGAGPDFCSGADLAELQRISEMGYEENLRDARALGALFTRMRRLPKPVIAAVRGRALAGGCGLATACDIVLAADDAQLGYPEVHLGFVPALVMTILRRKVTESKAFELVARGARFDAREAERIGLVTRVLPADSFDDDVAGYARDLATRPASALELTKGLLYELGDLDFDEGMERAAQVNVRARMTDACRDGVRRFLGRSAG